MQLTLYNTRSRRKEEFAPSQPERVSVYVCGPTVYAPPHIGNARAAVVFDQLARLLRRLYPRVVYVRNITDIDDKIIAAAKREGKSADAVAKSYHAAYMRDMARLHILPPDRETKATEHIPHITKMIARLLDLRHAYAAEGHVLFHVPSCASYGCLSGRDRRQMLAGARVEVAPYKRDPSDFVLWKPSAADEPAWDSPWGRGRPGWHIECSAMIHEALGETIDIHGAGEDLIFPHNENERAQSVSAHGGAELARFWMHNGLVRMRNAKMSKSEGSVILLPDLLRVAHGETIRYALLSTHYRQPLDWSERLLEQAGRALGRLYRFLRDFEDEEEEAADKDAPAAAPPQDFMLALLDDLNVPKALGIMGSLLKRGDRDAARQIRAAGDLLGLLQSPPRIWLGEGAENPAASSESASEAIEALLRQREAARAKKDFAEADRIRDRLAAEGVRIEDREDGARWFRGE